MAAKVSYIKSPKSYWINGEVSNRLGQVTNNLSEITKNDTNIPDCHRMLLITHFAGSPE